MSNSAAPSINKTNKELEFDILSVLCDKFMGLSPFEVLNTNLEDVLDLYVNCVIHESKNKTNKEGDQWLTSNNASWH